MRYSELHLLHTARMWPGWQPNNAGHTPYVERLRAPEWAITREPGEHVYTAEHVATGEVFEVPLANVRAATRIAEKPAAKGGKRG